MAKVGGVRIDVDWQGDKYKRLFRQRMSRQLASVGRYLRTRTKQNISKRVRRKRSRRTGKLYVVERSKPGEFPRKDKGLLYRQTFWSRVAWNEIIVGSGRFGEARTKNNAYYAAILESAHLNRHFLSRTLLQERKAILAILRGGYSAGAIRTRGFS